MEVEAYIYGKKIGTIISHNGIIYFQYDKNFKDYHLEISPLKLPISLNGVYTNNEDIYFEGLAGVFHDTLPDKFGTKIIHRYYESKNIPVHELNVIQKLMFIGDKSVGAIEYKPQEHKLNDKTKEIIELQNFYNNAKKVINSNEIEAIEEMLLFMDSAASAGGARAKAVVGWDKKNKQIISGLKENLPQEFEHYLLKFDMEQENGQSSNYTKLEYLYMNMAQEVGINVPEVELIEHNNLFHYLIKRFDRTNGEKIHLHSVAGLTHSNFNIPAHYSYDELFRLTRFLTGSQQAVEEQYKRMVFNIVARNQDDHAKNFAFMMNKQGVWDISPAYDITYANGAGYTKNHQLSLKGKVNNFTTQDLLSLADEHSIDKTFAEYQIKKTVDLLSNFKVKAKDIEIDSKFINIIDKNLRLDL